MSTQATRLLAVGSKPGVGLGGTSKVLTLGAKFKGVPQTSVISINNIVMPSQKNNNVNPKNP